MPEWIKISIPVIIVVAGWLWYASGFQSEVMLRLRSIDDEIKADNEDFIQQQRVIDIMRERVADLIRHNDRQDIMLEHIYERLGPLPRIQPPPSERKGYPDE